MRLLMLAAILALPGCVSKPVIVACAFCKQAGKAACTPCKGAKVTACSRCDGRGVRCCPTCEGKMGTKLCDQCKAESPANVCRNCKGTATTTCHLCVKGKRPDGTNCHTCRGQGTYVCGICVKGTGKAKACVCCLGQKATAEIRAAHPGGECASCKGTGSVECRTCRGTAIMTCTHCNGKGSYERKSSSGSSRRWSFDD